MMKILVILFISMCFQQPCLSSFGTWKFSEDCSLNCFGISGGAMKLNSDEFCKTHGVLLGNKCCANRNTTPFYPDTSQNIQYTMTQTEYRCLPWLQKRRFLNDPFCVLCRPLSCLFAKISVHHQLLCEKHLPTCRHRCGISHGSSVVPQPLPTNSNLTTGTIGNNSTVHIPSKSPIQPNVPPSSANPGHMETESPSKETRMSQQFTSTVGKKLKTASI